MCKVCTMNTPCDDRHNSCSKCCCDNRTVYLPHYLTDRSCLIVLCSRPSIDCWAFLQHFAWGCLVGAISTARYLDWCFCVLCRRTYDRNCVSVDRRRDDLHRWGGLSFPLPRLQLHNIYSPFMVKKQELNYRKQIARQLRTQYVEGIYDNPVTLKSRLTVTQGHQKRNH